MMRLGRMIMWRGARPLPQRLPLSVCDGGPDLTTWPSPSSSLIPSSWLSRSAPFPAVVPSYSCRHLLFHGLRLVSSPPADVPGAPPPPFARAMVCFNYRVSRSQLIESTALEDCNNSSCLVGSRADEDDTVEPAPRPTARPIPCLRSLDYVFTPLSPTQAFSICQPRSEALGALFVSLAINKLRMKRLLTFGLVLFLSLSLLAPSPSHLPCPSSPIPPVPAPSPTFSRT